MLDPKLRGGVSGSASVDALSGDRSAAPPGTIVLPAILLSQSGQLAMREGDTGKPLFPGADAMFGAGYFTGVEITGLDPGGVHPKRTFKLDDQGRLNPFGTGGPIGSSYPYELALVGRDGARYRAVVDISPKKLGWSGQGYQPLNKVALERVEPPAPPVVKPQAPNELTMPEIMLSQSGQLATAEGKSGTPIFPGLPKELGADFISSITVVGLDPGGVHPKRTFSLDAQGRLNPFGTGGPIGSSYPYEIRLTAKDGTEYSAKVDISPSKVGSSHMGYETLKGLKFQRVESGSMSLGGAAPLDASSKGFLAAGGHPRAAPARVEASPAFFYLTQRS